MKRFLAGLILAGATLAHAAETKAQTNPFIINSLPEKPGQPSLAPTALLGYESKIQEVRPFALTSVSVERSSLPPAELANAVRPYVGKLVDKDALKRIAGAIADVYRRDGTIAFYSVIVPAQDFAGGAARLIALEGFVESVDIEGDTSGDLALLHAYSAPLSAERPLTRRTLDHTVALIRQIPGLSTDIRREPGSRNGALRLIVKAKQKHIALAVNANNRGTELLGRTAAIAHASVFDLTGGGEQLSVSYATATSTGRFRYAAADIAEPIGDEGGMVQLNIGYLRTKPAALVGRGEAETASLIFTQPLELTSTRSWLANGSIAGLNSRNALFGAQATDERVRAVRIGSTYSAQSPTYAASLTGAASFGLDALGARAASPSSAAPDFQKVGARFAYTQAFDDGLIVRLHSAFQYGFERLPVSEFFPLGGNEFGRAFPAAVISGDQALAGSFELAWRPSIGVDQIAVSELYGYLDGGEAWRLARGPLSATTQSLQSGGVGARMTFFDRLAAELELGRQIHVPASLPGSWQLSFSTTLSTP